MTWLDIVILVVLLLFVAVGFYKGLLRSVLSLVNFLVSFVAAIFLAKPLALLFNSMFGASTKLGGVIAGKLAENAALNAAVLEPTAAGPFINGIEGINFFLKKLMSKLAGNGVIATGATPAEYFGTLLGGICMLVIAGIVAFILIRLVLLLLNKLIKRMKQNGLFNWVDKMLGLLFGGIKGLAVVLVVFFVLSFFNWIPGLNNLVQKSPVARTMNEWSTKSADWIGKKINFKKILNGIISDKYENKQEPAEAQTVNAKTENNNLQVTKTYKISCDNKKINLADSYLGLQKTYLIKLC